MNIKRKLVIIIAVIAIMFSAGVICEAANYSICGVDIGYPAGAYFTDNGQACTDHSTKGIHSYYNESACNCICTYNGKSLGAVQCFGFARYVQTKLFGSNSYDNANGFYKLSGAQVAAGSLTESNLKSIIMSAKPGAHLRTQGSQHSMIITAITENGFSVIQCNGSNNKEYTGYYSCRIGTYTYTWASYVSSTYGKRGISYIELPKNYTLQESVDHNPTGALDIVEGGINSVRVRGWAFDNDSKTEALKIHVYIGDASGPKTGIAEITANGLRADVGSVYSGVGNYHGFDETIRISESGTKYFYVYAINVGTGENQLLGYTAVVITKDSTPPVITNQKVTAVTNTTYTVTCNVSDESGINSVRFPSWNSSKSNTDGKDAVWFDGTVSNGVATCVIPISELGGEAGTYVTHIYAEDKGGNMSCVGVTAEIDTTGISDMAAVNIGTNFTGYISNYGVGKVLTAKSSTNVVSMTDTEAASQRWTFIRNSDGTYYIKSNDTGYYLSADGSVSNSNVKVVSTCGSDAQKWLIISNKFGTYYLQPKNSSDCVMDLSDLNSAEGANIAIHTFNTTVAQQFMITDDKPLSSRSQANIGTGFYASIANAGLKKVLTSASGNVVSKTDTGASTQRWKFVRQENGTYLITSKADGTYMYNYEGTNNSNVYMNSTARSWDIYAAGDGSYYLRPINSSNCVMDLSDYNSAEGANIAIHEFNSSTAQRYIITKDTVSVTGVSLSASSATLTSKGATKQLTATVAPTEATNKKVIWTSSNTSVATVNGSGLVTAVGNGTATITAKTEDGAKTATCTITVSIPISVTGVSLMENELLFEKAGATQTLQSMISPANATNKTVTWSSSNTAVATVNSSGVVTAVANGTAVITVKTSDGSKTATCNVIVQIPVSVTGISLSQTSVKLTSIGSTADIIATVTPSNASNQLVGWTSSNTSVATVDEEGIVTAVSEGTATITAITEDGGKTATCKVTVSVPISVTGVTLSSTQLNFTGTGGTQQLTATIAPSNATNKNVTWSSGNTSIAKVSSSGLVTAVGEGTTVVTVATVDGNKFATCIVSVQKEAAHVHSYTRSVTKTATCKNTGTAVYSCSGCDSTYTETIPATGHVGETVLKFVKEPTCTVEGYSGDTYCAGCGELLSSGKTIAAKGHNWNTGVITKTATCTSTGVKTYTCTGCSGTKTETLQKTSHTVVTDSAVKATCNAEGKTEGSHCSKCNAVIIAQKSIPKTDHSWDAGRTTKSATCTEEGVKTCYCSVCGEAKEEAIAKVTHTAVTDKGTAATCTVEGKTDGSHCSVCGTVLKEQNVIKATGHKWDSGKITKKATAYEAGVKTYTCTNCNTTRTEAIKAIGGPSVGTQIKDTKTGAFYKITKADAKGTEVTFEKLIKKNKAKTVKVPDTVTYNGITFKVIAISSNACKGDKKLATVTIGSNVKVIGKSAFNGCKKLTKVALGANVTTIESSAFYKCAKLTSITIPAGVNQIGKQAFYNCKKLKKITIQTELLNGNNVGSSAFKGIYSKASVKVPAAKEAEYKKLLKKKGIGARVSVKK